MLLRKGRAGISLPCFHNGPGNLPEPPPADYTGKGCLSTKHMSAGRQRQINLTTPDLLQIPVDGLSA